MSIDKKINDYVKFVSLLLVILAIADYPLARAGDTPHVLEMDDRIIDYTRQGKWLIAFYAPWCGHCKKLEPVWEQLAKHYDGKPFNIARVDATRHIKATKHFEIKAYPTIKFIYGKKNLNYNGERKKDQIVDFLTKADSQPVYRIISRIDYLHHKKLRDHFFLLVGMHNDTTPITLEYKEIASRHYLESFFYIGAPDYISKKKTLFAKPTLGVVKEEELIFYDEMIYGTMENFVKQERFLQFGEITLSNFYLMLETRKILLILLYNPNNKAEDEYNKELKRVFKLFTKENRTSFNREFQFGYTENADLLNGIALWTFKTPVLFVLNSTSYEYATIDLIHEQGKASKVARVNFDKVLTDIRERKIDFYGGHSWLRNIRRPLWELYRAVIEMFVEAPFISLLIFGFPFGVISVVCYFLCCLDSVDEDELPEVDRFSESDLDENEDGEIEGDNGFANRDTNAYRRLSVNHMPLEPQFASLNVHKANIEKETSKKIQ